jgi:predicted transposase YbfD/YdcC
MSAVVGETSEYWRVASRAAMRRVSAISEEFPPMNPSPSTSLLEHLSILPDPRVERSRRHELVDIVALSICGVLAGAEGWTEIELFGRTRYDWFKTFLDLPHGIPSHDTFGRVFARLDPNAFETVFRGWVSAVQGRIAGVVAIDGKTLRGSGDAERGPIHLVSAWAAANRVVLGQVQTAAKSNEITAIPELLRALDVRGCIVTLDAMGCQKTLAEQITTQGGDYVLALKANHGTLHHNVAGQFAAHRAHGFAHLPHSYFETLDKDHGRIEVRRHWIAALTPDWAAERDLWPGLHSFAMVERERHIDGRISIETQYYLTSLAAQAARFAEAVRAHWGIENRLHWMMDVVFDEDHSRVRKDHGPANLARLRRLAQALLQQDTASKASLKARRRKAGWDPDYLMNLLIGKHN